MYIVLQDYLKNMGCLKKSFVCLCIILLIFLFCTGCIKMGLAYDTKVNKDANLDHAKISITTDNAGYGLLKSSAKSGGYSSIKEMMTKNITKSIGTDILYSENWEKDRSKVTISLERFGAFSPAADSKLKIQKIDNYVVYEDTTFNNPSATESTSSDSSTLTKEQSENLANMMLSGITLDYYVEMPGKIVESNADTTTDNKAEWHSSGADVFKTKIYAKSEIPLLPGFEAVLAILGIIVVACLFGVKRK
jgi:hypothetical protein